MNSGRRENDKLKILCVSPFDVYPPDFGGAIGVYYRLKYLKEKGHRIYCILPETKNPEHREFLEKAFDGVFFISRKKRPVSLIKFISGNSSYYSEKFTPGGKEKEEAGEFIISAAPDVFFMEGSHCMGIYYSLIKPLLNGRDSCAAHFSHNIEYNLSYNNFKDLGCRNVWKAVNFLNYLRLKKAEPVYLKEFRHIFSVSDDEVQVLKELSPKSDAEWMPPVLPDVPRGLSGGETGGAGQNGGVSVRGRGYDFAELYSDYDYRIVFVGRLGFPSNIKAAEWFSKKVFPIIREMGLNAAFILVGMHPADSIAEIAEKNKDIFLYGNVESVEPFIRMADAMVIPVFNDAGIKIKLIEALKFGKKVVARPEALAGSGLKGAVPSAETPEEFASKCAGVLLSRVDYGEVWKRFDEIYESGRLIERLEKRLYEMAGMNIPASGA